MKYLRLMRVKHYIKNLLVFCPLVFAGRLTDQTLLWRNLLGFAAFCLLSSAIYILNDLRDAPRDRQHPVKCKRPIASGAIRPQEAWLLFGILLLGVIALAFAVGGGVLAWLPLAVYLLLNLGYSLGLKNVPIVDIAILAAGFILRVLYGAAITNIEISKWLYLTVIALAFYMGLGKRRNELRSASDGSTRLVLQYYNQAFLDKNMYMCVALGVVFYSLWSVDELTIARVGSNLLVWTVPLVLLICFTYSLDIEGPSDGDPVEVLLGDRLLLALVAALGLALLAIVYL